MTQVLGMPVYIKKNTFNVFLELKSREGINLLLILIRTYYVL